MSLRFRVVLETQGLLVVPKRYESKYIINNNFNTLSTNIETFTAFFERLDIRLLTVGPETPAGPSFPFSPGAPGNPLEPLGPTAPGDPYNAEKQLISQRWYVTQDEIHILTALPTGPCSPGAPRSP